MLGLRVVAGGLLTVFALLNCGGSSTADSPGGMDGDASGGGASPDDMECAGAAGDGGCGGEQALEPYARLRTACNRNVRVNRRGTPVCISLHIH